MGSSMPTLGGITNLIRSETGVREGVVASQICTNHGGKALRAIDGNTDGYWHNGSVMHTCDRSAAWWKVDLGRDNAIITSVSVTNRKDCSGSPEQYQPGNSGCLRDSCGEPSLRRKPLCVRLRI